MRVAVVFSLLFAASGPAAADTGPTSFDNEAAKEWLATLVEQPEPQHFMALSMRLAETPSTSIAAWTGAVTIASAEVIATCAGNPPDDLPETVARWLAMQDCESISEMAPWAIELLGNVLDTDRSELAKLWSEADDSEWRANVAGLQRRLENQAEDDPTR